MTRDGIHGKKVFLCWTLTLDRSLMRTSSSRQSIQIVIKKFCALGLLRKDLSYCVVPLVLEKLWRWWPLWKNWLTWKWYSSTSLLQRLLSWFWKLSINTARQRRPIKVSSWVQVKLTNGLLSFATRLICLQLTSTARKWWSPSWDKWRSRMVSGEAQTNSGCPLNASCL